MFNIFSRIKSEASLGKLVADIAEILVVKFGYPYRGSNDKDLLFAVCRDFSKRMGKFELALYYLTTVATDSYPKGTEGTQPLRWIRAVQEAANKNEITLEQRDAFIESVEEFYGLNQEQVN